MQLLPGQSPSPDEPSHPKAAWKSALRRAFPPKLTGIVGSILSIALTALGVLDGFTSNIPAWYLPYALAATLFALLILSAYRFWVVAVEGDHAVEMVASLQKERDTLKESLDLTQRELTTSFRLVELDGLPVAGFTQFLNDRKTKPYNTTELDLFSITLELTGHPLHKDVHVVYRIAGVNRAARNLPDFRLSIQGEGPVRFDQLDARLFELRSDPSRARCLHPSVVGVDGNCKDLSLPFPAPGILPGGSFDIEFTYRWPRTFRLPKDYWFLDNANVAKPAKRVCLQLVFDTELSMAAQVYEFDVAKMTYTSCGEVPTSLAGKTSVTYENDHPTENSFYVLIVRADIAEAPRTTVT